MNEDDTEYRKRRLSPGEGGGGARNKHLQHRAQCMERTRAGRKHTRKLTWTEHEMT